MNRADFFGESTSPLPPPGSRKRRQVILITVVALILYAVIRLLPTGSNLSHMDFRVEKGNQAVLEFCDPANPQFMPVVAVRSPVVMTLRSATEPAVNHPAEFVLTLSTASGKPIGPAELLVAHTRKLHLMVVDPTLSDYQHIHPEPGAKNGEWVFAMTPGRAGVYRAFADFTPAATGRGLYASTDFSVPGVVATVIRTPNTTAQAAGCNFELVVPQNFRARLPVELTLRIEDQGAVKQPIQLHPVMGAFAHLVAFDEARSGFAHLHPDQNDLAQPPDSLRPELTFKVTIPQAGRYVIWAQVDLGQGEIFVPFWVDVTP